jgi:putative transposase
LKVNAASLAPFIQDSQYFLQHFAGSLYSQQTFYSWKKKYGGLGSSELRRMKLLEDESRKLKRLVADLSLDKHMLQEVIEKKL